MIDSYIVPLVIFAGVYIWAVRHLIKYLKKAGKL